MDKADFIRLAPGYYELAVLLVAWERDGFYSASDIEEPYIIEDPDDREITRLLQSRKLLKGAIDGLVAKGVIEVIEDHFGPALYKRGPNITQRIEELQEDHSTAFHKSGLAPNRQAWVTSALWKLHHTHNELEIVEADFDTPDQEWQPLPIDRDNKWFIEAKAAVDKTIDEVEQSNGYAAEHSEERASVLGNLKLLREKLETAKDISIGFVKTHGLSALRKLSMRFGNTAIGKIADLAIAALFNWLGLK